MKDEVPLHSISTVLADVARSVCYHPEEFHISEEVCPDLLRVIFKPHMGDIRLLIGRAGRQSNGFNHLANVMAMKEGFVGRSIKGEIVYGQCFIQESFVGERENRKPEFNPNFTTDDFYDAIVPVVHRALGRVPITVEVRPIEEDEAHPAFCAYLDVPEEQTATAMAIGDIFFPVGRRNGRKVKVKTLNSKFESEQRKRAGVA
jgi:predicted RNA-binding protein YlqC (UPF0109 family)